MRDLRARDIASRALRRRKASAASHIPARRRSRKSRSAAPSCLNNEAANYTWAFRSHDKHQAKSQPKLCVSGRACYQMRLSLGHSRGKITGLYKSCESALLSLRSTPTVWYGYLNTLCKCRPASGSVVAVRGRSVSYALTHKVPREPVFG